MFCWQFWVYNKGNTETIIRRQLSLVKKVIYSFTGIILCLFLTANMSFADSYNVYTPATYKQIQIVQSPKNTRISGYAVELLVDYSGSMGRWIGEAIYTLKDILPKIPDTTSVALRVFGEYNGQAGFQYVDLCKATRLVAYFKHENQENILKGLTEAKIGGMTPLEFALRETVEKDLRGVRVFNNSRNDNKNKKIILLTDGDDTCGGDPCEYIRQFMKSHRDIQIDVVQLGTSTNLMCLTTATGGTFYQVNGNYHKFVSAFEQTFNVPAGTVQRYIPEENSTQKPQSGNGKQRGYRFIKF